MVDLAGAASDRELALKDSTATGLRPSSIIHNCSVVPSDSDRLHAESALTRRLPLTISFNRVSGIFMRRAASTSRIRIQIWMPNRRGRLPHCR